MAPASVIIIISYTEQTSDEKKCSKNDKNGYMNEEHDFGLMNDGVYIGTSFNDLGETKNFMMNRVKDEEGGKEDRISECSEPEGFDSKFCEDDDDLERPDKNIWLKLLFELEQNIDTRLVRSEQSLSATSHNKEKEIYTLPRAITWDDECRRIIVPCNFADKIEIRKIRGIDHINGKGESFLKIRMAEEDRYEYQVGPTFMYQPEFEKAFRDNAETYDTNQFKLGFEVLSFDQRLEIRKCY